MLWEAVHSLFDLHVYEAVDEVFLQILLVDNFLRDSISGHFHVLKSVHWRYQVHAFDINAHIPGTRCTDCTIP